MSRRYFAVRVLMMSVLIHSGLAFSHAGETQDAKTSWRRSDEFSVENFLEDVAIYGNTSKSDLEAMRGRLEAGESLSIRVSFDEGPSSLPTHIKLLKGTGLETFDQNYVQRKDLNILQTPLPRQLRNLKEYEAEFSITTNSVHIEISGAAPTSTRASDIAEALRQDWAADLGPLGYQRKLLEDFTISHRGSRVYLTCDTDWKTLWRGM